MSYWTDIVGGKFSRHLDFKCYFRFFKEPTNGIIFLLLLMLLEAWPSKIQVLKHFLFIGLSLILRQSKAPPQKNFFF